MRFVCLYLIIPFPTVCVSVAQGNPNMIMALAGNKSDMLDARKVAAEVNT